MADPLRVSTLCFCLKGHVSFSFKMEEGGGNLWIWANPQIYFHGGKQALTLLHKLK